MIPKSGNRFSKKILLKTKKNLESTARGQDGENSHDRKNGDLSR
jgi:hypothetical protein